MPILHKAKIFIVLILITNSSQLHAKLDRIVENRMALVIGNSAYAHAPELSNPTLDAELIAENLNRIGFSVQLTLDADLNKMRRVLRDFSDRLVESGKNTISVIYFAGHGLQVRQNNYLLPIDAHINKESDTSLESIQLASILNLLFDANNRLNIVILDACRNNPFSNTLSESKAGLSGVLAPQNTLVAYSTAPDEVAFDGVAGTNSPFASALAKELIKEDLVVENVFKRTRKNVLEQTQRRQEPWFQSSVNSDFYLSASDKSDSSNPASASEDLFSRIAYFVEWRFFGADNGAHKLGLESFSQGVDYYGQRNLSPEQVIESKAKYYARWPNRRFSLVHKTLQITELDSGAIDVAFQFHFDVHSNKRNRRSRGLSRMSLGLKKNGNDFVILWQDERVLERNVTEG